jgi:glucans biosynthesis protein C
MNSEASVTSQRVYFLDACRGAFMLLGIVLHSSLPFTSVPWEIKAPNHSTTLDYVYYFIHAFRMQGFFIISGYFAALGLTRNGPSQWLGSRTTRLGVPLLFGVLFLVPLQSFALSLPQYLAAPHLTFGGYVHDAMQRHAKLGFHLLSHLWFIFDLLIMSLVLAAMHSVDRHGAARLPGRWIASILVAKPTAVGSLLLLGLSASLWAIEQLAYSRAGPYFMALGTYPMWKILDGWRLLYYAPFFAFGALLFRNPELFQKFIRLPALSWLAGAACLSLLIAVKVHRPDLALVAATLAAPSAILVTRMWMHAAALLLNRPSRAVRQVADAAYTMYIVHHPIVLFSAAAVIHWNVRALPGFAMVLSVALALSIGIYLAARHAPLASYLLNGIKPSVTRRARPRVA